MLHERRCCIEDGASAAVAVVEQRERAAGLSAAIHRGRVIGFEVHAVVPVSEYGSDDGYGVGLEQWPIPTTGGCFKRDERRISQPAVSSRS
jgi:hypothetical protein